MNSPGVAGQRIYDPMGNLRCSSRSWPPPKPVAVCGEPTTAAAIFYDVSLEADAISYDIKHGSAYDIESADNNQTWIRLRYQIGR